MFNGGGWAGLGQHSSDHNIEVLKPLHSNLCFVCDPLVWNLVSRALSGTVMRVLG